LLIETVLNQSEPVRFALGYFLKAYIAGIAKFAVLRRCSRYNEVRGLSNTLTANSTRGLNQITRYSRRSFDYEVAQDMWNENTKETKVFHVIAVDLEVQEHTQVSKFEFSSVSASRK